MIFVFGSNLAGIHGAGAAKVAFQQYGAVWGMGEGHYGNSYALPTKDIHIRTLPIAMVKKYVKNFITYAEQHPNNEFQVTRIGCGLAGFKDEEIAPLFKDAPDNCLFDFAWFNLIGKKNLRTWGTF